MVPRVVCAPHGEVLERGAVLDCNARCGAVNAELIVPRLRGLG
jgi:hypothetical protein